MIKLLDQLEFNLNLYNKSVFSFNEQTLLILNKIYNPNNSPNYY